MEEYRQLTLNDWMEMKAKLQAELLGIKKGFVKIGYWLRKIEESEGYKNDGYKTLSEWAAGEYGLKSSTVSRFMAINREYSEGGFSERLQEKYEGFNQSQLIEMLNMDQADREMVEPGMDRANIRELKEFNRTEPERGVADELSELVRKFFEENKETLKEVYAALGNEDAMKEVIIPSGSRIYKKGIFFLTMNESGLKLKTFGGKPEDYKWKQFFAIMQDIYGESLEKKKAENDVETSESDRQESAPEPDRRDGDTSEKGGETTEESEIAPAQKEENPREILDEKKKPEPERPVKLEIEEQIPGQDTILNHPEYLPEEPDQEQEEPVSKKKENQETPVEPEKENPKEQIKEKAAEKEVKQEIVQVQEKSDSEKKIYPIRMQKDLFKDLNAAVIDFLLVKNEKDYQIGDQLQIIEFDQDRNTGSVMFLIVKYVMKDCVGLEEQFCILGIEHTGSK